MKMMVHFDQQKPPKMSWQVRWQRVTPRPLSQSCCTRALSPSAVNWSSSVSQFPVVEWSEHPVVVVVVGVVVMVVWEEKNSALIDYAEIYLDCRYLYCRIGPWSILPCRHFPHSAALVRQPWWKSEFPRHTSPCKTPMLSILPICSPLKKYTTLRFAFQGSLQMKHSFVTVSLAFIVFPIAKTIAPVLPSIDPSRSAGTSWTWHCHMISASHIPRVKSVLCADIWKTQQILSVPLLWCNNITKPAELNRALTQAVHISNVWYL